MRNRQMGTWGKFDLTRHIRGQQIALVKPEWFIVDAQVARSLIEWSNMTRSLQDYFEHGINPLEFDLLLLYTHYHHMQHTSFLQLQNTFPR